MKKVLISLLALSLCVSISAQDALSLLRENPDRAANNMHSYEFCEIHDTPAPKGFKPFYITHYGRHGSRYEQNATFANTAIRTLSLLDSLAFLPLRARNFSRR